MKAMKYLFLMALLLIALVFLLNMKEGPRQQAVTVAFYNVENLFDTQDDPHIDDNEFLPNGKLKWTPERYTRKIANLSEVIDKLGDDDGPELLGLAEIENEKVIKDLLDSDLLKSKNYKFIHYDSPDRRGIDVALLFKNSSFKPFYHKAFTVSLKEDKQFKTRSILLVGGLISKDSIYVFVNHWPSRRGGETETEDHRIAAAHRLRFLIDSLDKIKSNAKVVVMGDFNDEPTNRSMRGELKAGHNTECGNTCLYNPFYQLQQEGEGSIKFKHEWNSFDQIIVSGNLVHSTHHSYMNNSANIYHPDWMHYKENKSNGPFRTYQGLKYYGGYSDHFPVFIQLNEK